MKNTFYLYSGHDGGDTWVECTVADLENLQRPNIEIHPTANIGKGTFINGHTIIGEDVSIGDYSYIQGNFQKGTSIGSHTKISSGVSIGEFCVIGDHVRIEELCNIGECVTIESYTKIERCTTIGQDSWIKGHVGIGSSVVLKDCVLVSDRVRISSGSTLQDGVHVDSGADIGNSVIVGKNSYIGRKAGLAEEVHIGESVFIDPHAVIGKLVNVEKDSPLIHASIKGYNYCVSLIGNKILFKYRDTEGISKLIQEWKVNGEKLLENWERSEEILSCVQQLINFQETASRIVFIAPTEREIAYGVKPYGRD